MSKNCSNYRPLKCRQAKSINWATRMDADRLTQDDYHLLESKYSTSNLRAQKMLEWELRSMVHAGQGAFVYVTYKQDP